MENAQQAIAGPLENFDEMPLSKQVAAYLVLAFGLSWLMTILAIKLHAREEFLNFGTAGPALAAMILSFRGKPDSSGSRLARCCWFFAFLLLCWNVLSLHYLWRASERLEFHLDPLLIGPAIFPAWVLSGFCSRDPGTRGLVKRLVHRPNWWGLTAILALPAMLLIPSAIAHHFGGQLVSPGAEGSRSFILADATAFFSFNLLFVAVLEEPGWRGLLLDRLQTRFSPLLASLLVWFPWALWHGPVDYYRPTPWTWTQYVLLRVVFLVPLTIILTWFYNRSGRSIQTAALFHAGMNTTPYVLPYFPPAWALIFAWAGYAVIADRMWRRNLKTNGRTAAVRTL
jgi:membrane protease YdiL (CAAX protease family)